MEELRNTDAERRITFGDLRTTLESVAGALEIVTFHNGTKLNFVYSGNGYYDENDNRVRCLKFSFSDLDIDESFIPVHVGSLKNSTTVNVAEELQNRFITTEDLDNNTTSFLVGAQIQYTYLVLKFEPQNNFIAEEVHKESRQLVLPDGTIRLRNIGPTRRMDDLGRIVIPREVRRIAGFEDGDMFEIFLTADNLILMRRVSDEYERGGDF